MALSLPWASVFSPLYCPAALGAGGITAGFFVWRLLTGLALAVQLATILLIPRIALHPFRDRPGAPHPGMPAA